MEIRKSYIDLKSLTGTFDSKTSDEIILLAYEKYLQYSGEEYEKIKEASICCKIRKEPRKFERFYASEYENIFIYYWSIQTGAYVCRPKWKVKDKTATTDLKECIELVKSGARGIDAETGGKKKEVSSEDAEIGTKKESNAVNVADIEMEWALDFLNDIHPKRNSFTKDAYGMVKYSWLDWDQYYFDLYYRNGVFSIDGKMIQSLRVTTVSDTEVYEAGVMDTLKGATWKKEDFLKLILAVDAYDSYVEVTYEQDGKIVKEYIRLGGNKIQNDTDMFGLKQRIEEELVKRYGKN